MRIQTVVPALAVASMLAVSADAMADAMADVMEDGARLRLCVGQSAGASATVEIVGGPEFGEALLVAGPLRADVEAGVSGTSEREAWTSLERHLGLRLEVEALEVSRLSLDGLGSLTRFIPRDIPNGFGFQALLIAPGGGPFQGATNVLVPADITTVTGALGGIVATGEIVITEFMKDPTFVTDSRGEWIELFNPGTAAINIEGWVLSDLGSNSHTLFNRDRGLWVPAGAHYLLGNSNDLAANGTIGMDYRYTGYTLSNGDDEIILSRPDGTLVDSVIYDNGVSWPDEGGKSISLNTTSYDAVLNDDPAQWCQTDRPIHRNNSDTGTPRFLNDSCGP